jgi:hypothetical protein
MSLPYSDKESCGKEKNENSNVAQMTLTWVYFVASVFLYVGVIIFIGKEDKQLTQTSGKEYED